MIHRWQGDIIGPTLSPGLKLSSVKNTDADTTLAHLGATTEDPVTTFDVSEGSLPMICQDL
jgi:hypothetical protein